MGNHDSPNTLEKYQAEARQHRDRVIEASEYLKVILQYCEADIHRKWRNKRRDQKKAFLKRCCPDIPEKHRQDYDILSKYPSL